MSSRARRALIRNQLTAKKERATRAEKLFRISFRSNFMAARDYLIAFGGIIYEIDIRRRQSGRRA